MDAEIDALAAEHGFSGVVSVDRSGEVEVRRAYGFAHRAYGVPNTVDTRFAIASGTKGFTALVIASLVERGVLALATSARSLLGDDLPLIRDDVTVAHLLGHTSGIGDYLDEAGGWEPTDHVLPVPVHRLATAEDYLAVLDGFPTAFPPGDHFAYCNGGYVVLALLAERAAATPYHDLVRDTVLTPAGMAHTGFFRSDELPTRTATGYLTPTRTNVLHLPVRGVGDGGLFTTAADLTAFWAALFAGRVVSADMFANLVRPRTEETGEPFRYGLGFWLQRGGPAVVLEGMDAGISFRSMHDPSTRLTHTVLSNDSEGAWPIGQHLQKTHTP
jgi:CubicO group peptidase (beta-lactamase class C family)